MSLKHPLMLVTLLAACDSQVDGDHNGTPLAKLEGTVQNLRTAAITDAEVALVWENTSGSPDIAGGDSVEVEGNFPAAFKLSLYEPPPDALLNDLQDSRMGVAYIFAGVIGTDYSSEEAAGAGILGMDPDHLLVYLPEDTVPGSIVSTILRGTPSAGFHIYNVGHLTEAEVEQRQTCEAALPAGSTIQVVFDTCGGVGFDDFLPAPADLNTPLQVDLVDDLELLDVPNWT
jgi:hypothetical protein